MNVNRKPKLLLISDVWGKEKSSWINHYVIILEKHFEIKYYDSCDLGGVDKSIYTEENLHTQFVNGGIEKAVEHLLSEEKETVHILAFSMGGLLAWKAGLLGLKIKNLVAMSSTRLRYETEMPFGDIELFYGKDDAFKPNKQWFKNFELTENLYKNETHNFYQNKEIAEHICNLIIKKINW